MPGKTHSVRQWVYIPDDELLINDAHPSTPVDLFRASQTFATIPFASLRNVPEVVLRGFFLDKTEKEV